MLVQILGNVQFLGETLPKFRQKVSVFSKWARHQGDVGNSIGFTSGFGKFRVGPFRLISLNLKGKARLFTLGQFWASGRVFRLK
ncbi:Putative disease resistance TIR-NBS-LRR class protein [Prunus dulcis]|uniref:Disease resistance TIR-NBS-LRR class protein n=1 Tax=Prunus dulcis TaxID=3755 RepID=A0A5H2XW53_PRUDU|nr:Putative disease resistance TIR-NBS-LRR class protein [Prunus dulcis]